MSDNAADNGRVTLAVLGERLAHIQSDLSALKTDFRAFCNTYSGEHEKLEIRVAEAERQIARHNERLTIIASLTAAWATIAAALASFFGART